VEGVGVWWKGVEGVGREWKGVEGEGAVEGGLHMPAFRIPSQVNLAVYI
jgi:hypothetical protein